MKILKNVLIVLGILIAIPLIIALFVQKDYAVEREIVINKPNSEVFEYIKLLKNQNNFSKWATMDPNMKKTYRGTDGTIGFVSAWESNNDDVGAGEQEIIDIVEDQRIDYELRFIKPFKATNPAYMTTEALNENRTKVKWGFKGHMAYPFNITMLFIDFEEMVGDDFHQGLEKLKTELEKQL